MDNNQKTENFIDKFTFCVSAKVNKRSIEGETLVERVKIEYTSNIESVVSVIADWVAINHFENLVSVDDIREMFKSILEFRILQVNKQVPRGVDCKDLEIPCFLYAFIAKIGKFEDFSRALTVIPTSELCDDLQDKANAAQLQQSADMIHSVESFF